MSVLEICNKTNTSNLINKIYRENEMGDIKNINNEWLNMNSKKIDVILYKLTEIAFKNENPDFPIKEINSMFKSAMVEIRRQQDVINTLTEQLKQNNEN